MNQIVSFEQAKSLSATEIRSQVNLVQEVMQAVMKKDTHYGTIPGTPKPTLYKPGAEVLAATFRIAVSYKIEDLSTKDIVRYRVTAIGTHQTTGIVMGEGMGECSSGEEKYKWRKAGNIKEFNAAPENMRRIKYGYDKNKRTEYEIQQVRTEPADLANTVLKMACKRAQVAMTLNVTAASDIFTQDIEDLPEDLRESVDHETGEVRRQAAAPEFIPDEIFSNYKGKWKESISSGKKTAAAVIKWVNEQGNGRLTDAQMQELLSSVPRQPETQAGESKASKDPFVAEIEEAERKQDGQ